MLHVNDIHVYYGAIHAIKGVSFDVKEGEIVTLIGANGAGKSTILKTVSGLLHPKVGEISFMGQNLDKVAPDKIVTRGLAQVPEGRRVFLRMSVEENLEMGAYTQPKGQFDADLARVYDTFPRLKERRKQEAGTLSGGEQQMLAMGRIKLRMVRFDGAASNALASVTVTEDALRDYYDVTVDKYTTTDTNGVETVKKFEDVRAEVEKEVRLIESVQGLTTGLYSRVYGVKAAAGKSRLDEIAAESSAKVETSDWFALGGNYKDGFMKRASQICPGAQNFEEVVAELDSSSEDLRYGVVASDKEVWLVEKAETNAAHVPTFEEAKDIIRPRALAAAKADAFKAKVEAIAKKGVKAVLESGDVSTNITFTVCDMKSGDFPDQGAIVGAAMKLRKGEVSEFAPTGVGKAILVVCEDRVPGDAAKAQIWKLQVRSEVEALQRRQVPESWKKWNLDRLGFEPGEGASIVDAEIEE